MDTWWSSTSLTTPSKLEYVVGRINGDVIGWGKPDGFAATNLKPAVAMTADGFVVILYGAGRPGNRVLTPGRATSIRRGSPCGSTGEPYLVNTASEIDPRTAGSRERPRRGDERQSGHRDCLRQGICSRLIHFIPAGSRQVDGGQPGIPRSENPARDQHPRLSRRLHICDRRLHPYGCRLQ